MIFEHYRNWPILCYHFEMKKSQKILDPDKKWDLIVIGGGPAGMMSAVCASEKALEAGRGPKSKNPYKILLIEKNETLGKKLLITGGGRCNVTNAEFDDHILLSKFKDAGKFLFSAFSQHSVRETLEFFNTRGMATKVEAEKRVFPVSDSAQSVFDVLFNSLKNGSVTILSNTKVNGFIQNKTGQIDAVKVSNNKSENNIIYGAKFILATGGKSHPETGSTGEGFTWLEKLGHTIIKPTASLVPIEVSDTWVKKLSGISLSKAKITIFQNGIKQTISKQNGKGKVLFTHFGLSGPTILNMSSEIGELMKYGEVVISLDILPEHDYSTLNTTLQNLFKKESNKKFKNAISNLIPSAFVPIILLYSGIDSETFCHSVTRDERLNLIKILKDLHIHPTKLLGEDKAIVTSGGVELSEIDFRTMQSKIISNLYLIGDILNINRPSGGYSLQLCWTTGHVAGSAVVSTS